MRTIIIKEGPFVFIKKALIIELFACIFLIFISFLENYEELYRGVTMLKSIRYDIFRDILFSLFQIIVIFYAFISWYMVRFEVRDRSIVRVSGIFIKRENALRLSLVDEVSTKQGFLERFIRHGTIYISNNQNKKIKIRNVYNFRDTVSIIEDVVERSKGQKRNVSVKDLLERGEGEYLEYKETLRFDIKQNKINKEIEKSSVKSIAGFLNSFGGTLLIGVNDKGEVMGLEKDLGTINKKDRDGFENFLNTLIKVHLGARFRNSIGVRFEKVSGKDVCIVEVDESLEPVFVKGYENLEEFFVRTGNSTTSLSFSEAQNYIKEHWKGR